MDPSLLSINAMVATTNKQKSGPSLPFFEFRAIRLIFR
jgi:hypothetical protein